MSCRCIFSFLLPRLFILLFRFFEGLAVDEVGDLGREHERILLTTNLHDRHQLLVLEEVAEVDMEEVTLISVDHDIVGVTITKTQHVARHAITGSGSNEDVAKAGGSKSTLYSRI